MTTDTLSTPVVASDHIPLSSLSPSTTSHPLRDDSTTLSNDSTSLSPAHITTGICLDKLSPVHHSILEQLSLVAPTKALVLSRQCLKILSPVVYRHAIASQGLIYGIFNTSPEVWTRKIEMLGHVRTLEISEMSAMWMLGRLKYPSSATNGLFYDQNVFAGVTKVLITREVYNGFYYKTENGSRDLLRFDEVWEDFKGQVPMVRGYEVMEYEFMETWRRRCEEYGVEDVQPVPQILPAVVPSQQVPQYFQQQSTQPPALRPEEIVCVATQSIILFMIPPLLISLLVSLSGGVLHNSKLVSIHTDEESSAVQWRINAGVASGCMWYDGTG
ncbi:hypothetical protein IAT38_003074 [Cryptococcus sp. DSM 104549]